MDLTKIKGWLEKGETRVRSLLPRRKRYAPERHYMRGPGPRSRRKQNGKAGNGSTGQTSKPN